MATRRLRYTIPVPVAAAVILAALALCARSLGGLAVARAQSTDQATACSDASIQGAYGFYYNGAILNGSGGSAPSGAMPAVAVGTYTADGAGNATVTATENIVGHVEHLTATGSYVVNADCTGTDVEASSNGETIHNSFVITKNGSHVNFMETDSGRMFIGVAKLIGAAACSNETWNGAFSVLSNGLDLSAPGGSPLPLSVIGLSSADGAGNLTNTLSVDVAGSVTQDVQTGTYTVNADCTVDTTLTSSTTGQTAHTTGVLENGGSEVAFISTDANSWFSGEAQRQ